MFGLSSSKQSSQSTSSSLGLNVAASESLSQGFSQSTSGGQSQQSIAFADLFAKLYGDASGAAATASQNVPLFQGEAAQLFSGGIDFLSQLQGGPGATYMQDRLTGPDAAAEAQLGALSENLGSFFQEQLMPGITAGGVSSGTLGGSRQGVTTSLAAKQVAGQYSQGAAQILGNSQAQRDALAVDAQGQRIQAAGTGLANLPALLGLSSAGANASLSPLLALSQILGGPTVLTSSTQQAQASSADLARALSQSFGFDSSTSQSTSKGKSFGISVGPGSGKG